METKTNPVEKGKTLAGRKIVITLVVVVVFLALVLAARYLVGSVDIVELLKRLHGG